MEKINGDSHTQDFSLSFTLNSEIASPSLSLLSELPHIRNWFSSYRSDYSQKDSNGEDFWGSLSETADQKEEKERSKDLNLDKCENPKLIGAPIYDGKGCGAEEKGGFDLVKECEGPQKGGDFLFGEKIRGNKENLGFDLEKFEVSAKSRGASIFSKRNWDEMMKNHSVQENQLDDNFETVSSSKNLLDEGKNIENKKFLEGNFNLKGGKCGEKDFNSSEKADKSVDYLRKELSKRELRGKIFIEKGENQIQSFRDHYISTPNDEAKSNQVQKSYDGDNDFISTKNGKFGTHMQKGLILSENGENLSNSSREEDHFSTKDLVESSQIAKSHGRENDFISPKFGKKANLEEKEFVLSKDNENMSLVKEEVVNINAFISSKNDKNRSNCMQKDKILSKDEESKGPRECLRKECFASMKKGENLGLRLRKENFVLCENTNKSTPKGKSSLILENPGKENVNGENLMEKDLSLMQNNRNSREIAEKSPDIAGKWQCPRKNKKLNGPPLKQLHLEKWVHRIQSNHRCP